MGGAAKTGVGLCCCKGGDWFGIIIGTTGTGAAGDGVSSGFRMVIGALHLGQFVSIPIHASSAVNFVLQLVQSNLNVPMLFSMLCLYFLCIVHLAC